MCNLTLFIIFKNSNASCCNSWSKFLLNSSLTTISNLLIFNSLRFDSIKLITYFPYLGSSNIILIKRGIIISNFVVSSFLFFKNFKAYLYAPFSPFVYRFDASLSTPRTFFLEKAVLNISPISL